MPNARSTIALTALPDGEEWYAERVRYHTTTDYNAEQLHQIIRVQSPRRDFRVDAQ